MYDDTRRQADELRALTSDRVLALLEDACERAGRELTHSKLRALSGLQ